ncbi:MAG: GGDEF domain-containing protein [Deltaproteobacteria bacterium]|nr:GGDEF domain-containing protein [bacterium]MCB9477906.1 GGDEF domain-containing protein [Deltaproteobacteria bacterium]MCB9479318.1 GGDEF domain-containing protein [Deltaproteobacteria bacterium]MCB9488762.1 GGDEF domain-containing protein [Deltaproteobacteria bacterium]
MRTIDQALQEQMRIDEVEIASRKRILDITALDLERLRACLGFIEVELDNIVNRFYERQTSIEEIALVIGDADTLKRLKGHMCQYVLDFFAFHDEIEYVNNRLRIGLVHKRIGVEPKLYLSGVKTLKDILADVLIENIPDAEESEATLRALDKIFYFDTTLVFDTYIRSLLNEVEYSKEKIESYAVGLEEKVQARTRELEDLVRHDALTGLYNRRAFREFMDLARKDAERQSRPIALVYFDIDAFKEINDNNGHTAGDHVLRAVGRVLKDIKRGNEVGARMGGDEFCVLMPNSDAESAKVFAERFIREIHQQAGVRVSIGIAHTGPQEFCTVEMLIREADRLMYQAKHAGGGSIRAAVDPAAGGHVSLGRALSEPILTHPEQGPPKTDPPRTKTDPPTFS